VAKRKRRIGKYPKAFRQAALERMKTCDSISQLAAELGVNRTQLYRWRWKLGANDEEGVQHENTPIRKLQKQNRELMRILSEKTLEVDFFKGALQKIEARRQKNSNSGETGSTTKSGS
jgi:transposase